MLCLVWFFLADGRKLLHLYFNSLFYSFVSCPHLTSGVLFAFHMFRPEKKKPFVTEFEKDCNVCNKKKSDKNTCKICTFVTGISKVLRTSILIEVKIIMLLAASSRLYCLLSSMQGILWVHKPTTIVY